MPILTTAVLHYLQEVLGIQAPGVKPWARVNELPYFLRDAFQFSELELLGQPIVLAIGRADARQSLSDVRIWLDKVKADVVRLLDIISPLNLQDMALADVEAVKIRETSGFDGSMKRAL